MTIQYLCASCAVRKDLARIHDADKGVLSRTCSKIIWSYETKRQDYAIPVWNGPPQAGMGKKCNTLRVVVLHSFFLPLDLIFHNLRQKFATAKWNLQSVHNFRGTVSVRMIVPSGLKLELPFSSLLFCCCCCLFVSSCTFSLKKWFT